MAKRGGRVHDDRQFSLDFGLGGGPPADPVPAPVESEEPPPSPRRRHDLYVGIVPDHALAGGLIMPTGHAYLRSEALPVSVRSAGVLHISLTAVGRYDREIPDGDVARAWAGGTPRPMMSAGARVLHS